MSRANKLSISPNPTHGRANIEIADNDKLMRIKVYSISGKVLYQEKLDGTVKKKALDFDYLNKGVYFIEVQTEKSRMTQKLIIQ